MVKVDAGRSAEVGEGYIPVLITREGLASRQYSLAGFFML